MRAVFELTSVILVLFSLLYTAVGMSDFAHQFLNTTNTSLFSLFFLKNFWKFRIPLQMDKINTRSYRNINVSFNSSTEADLEEDLTFKILDRGVNISRSEALKVLKRVNLERYGYKREVSTNRRLIESNKSEFKVSPTIFLTPTPDSDV